MTIKNQRDEGHADHPLKAGETVAVFAFDPRREPYLEGWAFITGKHEQAHMYRVRFYGERAVRIRFINPDWQPNADRSFALLLEFWRANASPGSFEEFFPDETM